MPYNGFYFLAASQTTFEGEGIRSSRRLEYYRRLFLRSFFYRGAVRLKQAKPTTDSNFMPGTARVNCTRHCRVKLYPGYRVNRTSIVGDAYKLQVEELYNIRYEPGIGGRGCLGTD